MKEDFEKLREIYQNIYSITLKISELINENNIEEIRYALDKREIFIKKRVEFKSDSDFSDNEKAELNDLILQITSIEDKNVEQLQTRQNLIKQRLLKLNRNYKILSSYKFKYNIKPVIVDKKE